MEASDYLRACIRLHLAEGVGATTYRRLMEAFGGPETALSAGPTGWLKVQGVGAKTVEAIEAVTAEDVDAELAEAEKHDVEILCWQDDRFPRGLQNIYDRPAVLYVRGELRAADALALGVVGSRRCTHYGMEQAERFGQLFAQAGFTVVSGGARGIDTASHRGALTAGGRTVAVMGCGLSRTYPPENRKLFERIVADERGAVISELPMKTAVLAGNFPTRNRIISGMSLGLLVVEAARRSGSLHTAADANEQGRVVMAVPGHVDSPLSQGTNQLIRDGAILVQNLDDVLDALGDVGEKMQPVEETDKPALDFSQFTDVEQRLLKALCEGPRPVDELVRSTGVDSGRAVSSMTMLVLKGAVEQRPGNVFAIR